MMLVDMSSWAHLCDALAEFSELSLAPVVSGTLRERSNAG
jgi:hypothetical protein